MQSLSPSLPPRFIFKNLNPFSPLLPHRLVYLLQNPKAPLHTQSPPAHPSPDTPTPDDQFKAWIDKLKSGFTPAAVVKALRAQSDPEIALDIFRWTAQHRGLPHDPTTYLAMIRIARRGRLRRDVKTLAAEVVAGVCGVPSVRIYNSIIRLSCGRKFLYNRAFNVYRKMLASEDCKPTLQTYAMLFKGLLSKVRKSKLRYFYFPAVKSLTKQMKASGVIPDTFVLNMIIKAHSICLDMDEATMLFREMGLYGCEPNAYTYSYISKGLCRKGKVRHGFKFYTEMRKKGFVPFRNAYMILICSLSLERKFEAAIEVVFDMLSNSKWPDLLTYRTLLEGLCWEGRDKDAFDLLEELKRRNAFLGERTYKTLLNNLHVLRGRGR